MYGGCDFAGARYAPKQPVARVNRMERSSTPLVSIVTPSFNQGSFLDATISSVLNQTYPHIEYLVMDGGSTDGSVDIVRRHSARLAYWQSQPDRGFGDAIARGFDRSHGEILAYLNSDDLLAPDAIERAVEALARRPDALMVYGNRVCIDGDGRLLYYRPSFPWLARSPYSAMIIGQESCFWRRSAYVEAGGVDPDLRFAVDYDLFARIGRQGPIAFAPAVWGFFRKHPDSKTTRQYRTLGKQESARVQERVWGRRVRRASWLAVLLILRMHTLATMGFVRPRSWPQALPRPGRQRGLLRGLTRRR